jgi:hypothetical protein
MRFEELWGGTDLVLLVNTIGKQPVWYTEKNCGLAKKNRDPAEKTSPPAVFEMNPHALPV